MSKRKSTLLIHLYSPKTPTGDREEVLLLARDNIDFSVRHPADMNRNPRDFYCWGDLPINPVFKPQPTFYTPPKDPPIRTITLELDTQEPLREFGRIFVLDKNYPRARMMNGEELRYAWKQIMWFTHLPKNRRLLPKLPVPS